MGVMTSGLQRPQSGSFLSLDRAVPSVDPFWLGSMRECAKWLFCKAPRVSIPVEKANQTRAIHLRVAANAGSHLIRLLRVMSKPVVASYCTTFLKPEMMHIYRQVHRLEAGGHLCRLPGEAVRGESFQSQTCTRSIA